MEQVGFFQNEKLDKSKSVILSASRMTDMPKYYEKELIEEVELRIKKGIDIHTLVLWTKHANSLLNPKLKRFLYDLREKNILIYLHLTITGMGGEIIGKDINHNNLYLEKNSPNMNESIDLLNDVIEVVGNKKAIRIRIDPIIKLKNTFDDSTYSNLKKFDYIVRNIAKKGLKSFSMSFLEDLAHVKVNNRMKKLGWKIISPTDDERRDFSINAKKLSKELDVSIYGCCVKGLNESKCIDGYLLDKLHPLKKISDKKEPRKRLLCGCTKSIDIGGWPPKKCYTGCQYCYGNSSFGEDCL
jgi:hypothetical protein